MASVVHLIYRLETGGAERSLVRLLEHSTNEFTHEVACIGVRTPLAQEIEALGVPIHYLDLIQIARLRRVLSAADIVQGWMYYGNLLASAFAPTAARIAWNVRSSRPARGTLPARIRAALWLAGRMRRDAVVYNSEAGRADHRLPAPVTTVIPNGIETDLYRPDEARRSNFRDELGLGSNPLVALVGRFHRDKGTDDFAAMASRLRQRRPDVRFTLIGPGMEANNAHLTRAFDDAALTVGAPGSGADVQLLGRRHAMAEVYPGIDVLVLPSYREGMPNVLLEAMSCGVPCVATDVGDARTILGDDDRICAPGDVEALAARVDDVLTHGGGYGDRQRIVERYDMGRCASAYADLYRSLIS